MPDARASRASLQERIAGAVTVVQSAHIRCGSRSECISTRTCAVALLTIDGARRCTSGRHQTLPHKILNDSVLTRLRSNRCTCHRRRCRHGCLGRSTLHTCSGVTTHRRHLPRFGTAAQSSVTHADPAPLLWCAEHRCQLAPASAEADHPCWGWKHKTDQRMRHSYSRRAKLALCCSHCQRDGCCLYHCASSPCAAAPFGYYCVAGNRASQSSSRYSSSSTISVRPIYFADRRLDRASSLVCGMPSDFAS